VARDVWASHPSYLWFARRHNGPNVVGSDTQIVIEGFPRTANTFSVYAFQMAQTAPVRVAHHLHAPSQVIFAARRGVPAVVLVRPPEDAVLSLASWSPHVSLGHALAAYSRFYERLLPYRERCVAAEFRDVTSDLGRVIDAVNARYGTRFARFEHTPANVEACYALVEEKSRRPPWADAITRYVSGTIALAQLDEARAAGAGTRNGELSEARVARPSAVRRDRRDALRGAYLEPRLQRARRRAEQAYREFVGD
jgi:hypothetical protein